ncbi:Uma2 family endonuclease [Actinosynnema sp. CA-248983]
MTAMPDMPDTPYTPENMRGRPYTVDDLEGMPDDGRRYELIDGMLVVSPAPGPVHQKAVGVLVARLVVACPGDMHVFPAPFSVRTSRSTELQPDVVVARDEDVVDRLLAPPVLVVEVLSPSTRLYDINTKKAAYERMGVASYWVIDPRSPKLSVFELDDLGLYQLVAEVENDDAFDAVRPFPVRIVPSELLGSLK